MNPKHTFLLLPAAMLSACAATPGMPVATTLPVPARLEIFGVSARPVHDGLRVAGRVRRPTTSYGNVPYRIEATAQVGDHSKQVVKSVPWPRMSNRGPRTASFSIFLPVIAAGRTTSVTVALVPAG